MAYKTHDIVCECAFVSLLLNCVSTNGCFMRLCGRSAKVGKIPVSKHNPGMVIFS